MSTRWIWLFTSMGISQFVHGVGLSGTSVYYGLAVTLSSDRSVLGLIQLRIFDQLIGLLGGTCCLVLDCIRTRWSEFMRLFWQDLRRDPCSWVWSSGWPATMSGCDSGGEKLRKQAHRVQHSQETGQRAGQAQSEAAKRNVHPLVPRRSK